MAEKADARRLWLPLLAVGLTISALWITNRSVTPHEATWDDVVAEARVGGYRLITTDEVNRRIRTDPKSTLLVDTRQEWEYAAEHMAGAVNFPMEPTSWSRWSKKEALAQLLGPDKDRFIVFS